MVTTCTVREVLGITPPVRVSRDTRKNTFEARIPFHFNVSVHTFVLVSLNYLILSPSATQSRKDVARQFRSAVKVKTRRLVPSKPTLALDEREDEGFIRVGKRLEIDPRAESPPPNYRTITGPKGALSESSDDGQSDAPSSFDEDTIDSYSAETARLSRVLSEDMSNVPAWLDLIAHSASTNPTSQGRASIWLTMLEKALASHPSNTSSVALRLRFLQAVRDARSAAEEDAAWERALMDIQSETLWIEYIGHRLAQNGPGDLEAAIGRVWREVGKSEFDPRRRYFAQLRVFWRTMTGLREAGQSS